MSKKITVDVDADVSKAKRKVQEIAESGGSAGGDVVSPAAEKTAQALGKTAKNAEQLGNQAKASAEQLTGMAKAFTGLAIGMAANYASRRFGDDSAMGRALGYAGNTINGAVAGAMAGRAAGPWGVAAGAILGAGAGAYGKYDEYATKDEEKAKAEKELREANLESIEVWEKARARTAAFKEELEKLTKSESGLEAAIKDRQKVDSDLAKQQRDAIGDTKQLNRLNRERQTNAGEIDALQSALKALTAKTPTGAYRIDMSGVDALAKIGGASGSGLSSLERTSKEQLATLKSIDAKTGKGGSWQ